MVGITVIPQPVKWLMHEWQQRKTTLLHLGPANEPVHSHERGVVKRRSSLQCASKCIKPTSSAAGRHGGSVNGWTCEQQVMIAVQPRPLRACEASLPVIHLSAVCCLHMVILCQRVTPEEDSTYPTLFVQAQQSLCLHVFISNILPFQGRS